MHSNAVRRRRHGNDLKTRVLAECTEPGASVAAVAQSHGLNANLVHKWRRERRQPAAVETTVSENDDAGGFIPLQLPQPAMPAVVPDITIELRRGATTVKVVWPAPAAGECAAWMREWLR